MARISGIVFIIVGIIVTITSYFFVEEIFVFSYIGILFIVWGIIKIIYKKLTSPSKKKTDFIKQHKKHRNRRPHCPYCNKVIVIHDNFCSNCGALLKNQRSNPNFQNTGQQQYNKRYQN